MAEIVQEDKQKGGKRRPKKHSTNIDMTPMVDLMCLLITFFMLTTAFSKPKIMQIVLPEKIKDREIVERPKIVEYRTVNVILGPDDKIFWYPGKLDPANPPVLQETDFSDTGLRAMLIERNRALFNKIADFNNKILTGEIKMPEDSVEVAVKALKKDDDTGPIVLIKPYKTSVYKNFVDIIDEMSIVGIGTYTFTDINWAEEQMVERALGETASTGNTDK